MIAQKPLNLSKRVTYLPIVGTYWEIHPDWHKLFSWVGQPGRPIEQPSYTNMDQISYSPTKPEPGPTFQDFTFSDSLKNILFSLYYQKMYWIFVMHRFR